MEAESVIERAGGRASTNREADELRTHLHGMWSAVADGWAQHAEYADARSALTTVQLLDMASPQAGERVLELACGPGGAGFVAAERVGPEGEVVLSDVAPEMTRIAARRASARGLTNVRTRVLDLERIDEPDGSYDVVLCREGLMFAADPARAGREIRRVLAPGGRVAVAVWGARERNPWLGVVFDAVSAQVGAPLPPPGVPGPFSLADAERLAAVLADAELDNVVVTELSVPLRAGSFEEWWVRTSALAGPLAKRLASLPDEAVQALRSRAREAARPYETPTGLEFPGVALLAAGRVAVEEASLWS